MDYNWVFKPYAPTRNHLRGIIVTYPDGREEEYDSIATAAKGINLPYHKVRLALKKEEKLEGYSFRDKDK